MIITTAAPSSALMGDKVISTSSVVFSDNVSKVISGNYKKES
jgi:hypothetical protein